MRLRRVKDQQPPKGEPSEGDGAGGIEGTLPTETVSCSTDFNIQISLTHHQTCEPKVCIGFVSLPVYILSSQLDGPEANSQYDIANVTESDILQCTLHFLSLLFNLTDL